MRKASTTAPPGAGEHGPRSRQHTAWRPWDITQREKKRTTTTGQLIHWLPCRKLQRGKTNWLRKNRMLQCAVARRRMPDFQGVGPCLGLFVAQTHPQILRTGHISDANAQLSRGAP